MEVPTGENDAGRQGNRMCAISLVREFGVPPLGGKDRSGPRERGTPNAESLLTCGCPVRTGGVDLGAFEAYNRDGCIEVSCRLGEGIWTPERTAR
jgi:hypothetical protein